VLVVPARTDVHRRSRQAGPVVAAPRLATTGSPQHLFGRAGGRSLAGSVRASPAEPVFAARHSRAGPATGPQRLPSARARRPWARPGWWSCMRAGCRWGQRRNVSDCPQDSGGERWPCCTTSSSRVIARHRVSPPVRPALIRPAWSRPTPRKQWSIASTPLWGVRGGSSGRRPRVTERCPRAPRAHGRLLSGGSAFRAACGRPSGPHEYGNRVTFRDERCGCSAELSPCPVWRWRVDRSQIVPAIAIRVPSGWPQRPHRRPTRCSGPGRRASTSCNATGGLSTAHSGSTGTRSATGYCRQWSSSWDEWRWRS